jgi:cytosine/adenosine deaminase-related metal-dependent hydrolase
MPFSLRARWVVPVDGPPIAGGCVAVLNGRILSVGSKSLGGGPVQNLGDVVLLPGLVNAHTHLEFSGLARLLGTPGMSLPAWIRLVIAERKRSDRDAAEGIAAGIRESLVGGVTTVGEIATAPAACYATRVSAPTIVQFQEAIGFSAGRVDSVFADLVQRLDAIPQPAGLSPHAPYTVHPQLLERIVQLAASRDMAVAMHLAESREELQLLASGEGEFRELLEERSMWDADAIPKGSRPFDYLRTLATAPRSLVIHGNYLDASEIDFIAKNRQRMSVVYCPRTHVYFGHSCYPLREMLLAGVRVALGTDSRASNPDLRVLHEMRRVRQNFPQIPADEIVRMATLHGAEALGLATDCGSLTEGKRADVIALPCPGTFGDPYEAIVSGSSAPTRVWLHGQEVELSPEPLERT